MLLHVLLLATLQYLTCTPFLRSSGSRARHGMAFCSCIGAEFVLYSCGCAFLYLFFSGPNTGEIPQQMLFYIRLWCDHPRFSSRTKFTPCLKLQFADEYSLEQSYSLARPIAELGRLEILVA